MENALYKSNYYYYYYYSREVKLVQVDLVTEDYDIINTSPANLDCPRPFWNLMEALGGRAQLPLTHTVTTQ